MPPGSVAPFARKKPPAAWMGKTAGVLLVLGLAWLNVHAAVTVLSANGYISAGELNEDPPFIFSSTDAFLAILWLLSELALLSAAGILRSGPRSLAAGAFVVCAFTTYALWTHRPFPLEAYEGAFDKWAQHSVDLYGIRFWAKGLPAVATDTPIPESRRPAEINSVSPKEAIQLAGGRGIMLSWGNEGTWSSARKVYIPLKDGDYPPTEPRYWWRELDDGKFAAIQQSD
jgi:hypothetical protein